MSSGGIGMIVDAAIAVTTSATAAAAARRANGIGASATAGHTSMTIAAARANHTSSCCAVAVPNTGITKRLNASAPTTAPTVLAAYRPPTSRAGSCERGAIAAIAIGKLAPQKKAAGSTAIAERSTSI